MENQIIPPLAVHFIWHSDDGTSIHPIIKAFRRYLTRDIERPFSRELNIPTFLYSNREPKSAPAIPAKLADRDVIFLFLSANTVMSNEWKEYIERLPVHEGYSIVPVAIDSEGQQHAYNGRLQNLNFVRAYRWFSSDSSDLKEQYGILELSHELYRYGLNDISPDKPGVESSIKLFLSHAKQGDTGLKHAEKIKQFIDNSNMRRFFDANEISPGFRFDKEIENHIKASTVIAIASDAYSSRYWCQREILSAKRERRPIILVNSLEHYEDRVFPAASNIPCVHITAEPLEDKDTLRILIAAILETIRFQHAHKLLKYYQDQEWIDRQAHIFARPPEIQQIVELLKDSGEEISELVICYPEPPLYKEETNWTDYFNLTVATPLWNSQDNDELEHRIGLSISDYSPDGYTTHNQDIDELKRFSQSLARHLLARKNTLIYGGDLRGDGFTQFILDEAAVLRDRLQVKELFVENYLAWPLYTRKDNTKWYAKYSNLVKPCQTNFPDDIRELIGNPDNFLEPNCTENRYIWSRCLTEMRRQSIQDSDVRILAGGKLEGYLGKMPGLLEEFMIAYESGKPIYLVGGLGGLVTLLCNSIKEKKIADEFTEDWQITHNAGYKDLQDRADQFKADYANIKVSIESIDIQSLAEKAGLSVEEYRRIMHSPFIDESIHLILKGLRAIKNRA